MTETTKHVLAACNGQGQPIAYLAPTKSWTNSLTEAVHFASQHEADEFLHANAHERNPGPVRSVPVSTENELLSEINLSQDQSETTRLFTGIYG